MKECKKVCGLLYMMSVQNVGTMNLKNIPVSQSFQLDRKLLSDLIPDCENTSSSLRIKLYTVCHFFTPKYFDCI